MLAYHGLCYWKVTHLVTLSEIAPETISPPPSPPPCTQNYEDKVWIKLWKGKQVFQNMSLEERSPSLLKHNFATNPYLLYVVWNTRHLNLSEMSSGNIVTGRLAEWRSETRVHIIICIIYTIKGWSKSHSTKSFLLHSLDCSRLKLLDLVRVRCSLCFWCTEDLRSYIVYIEQ